jgi:hypothetical protein
MRSAHEGGESETNSQDGPGPRRPRRLPAPQGSEAAYERLSTYTFPRRYVSGRDVADVVVVVRNKEMRAMAPTARSCSPRAPRRWRSSCCAAAPAVASGVHPAAPNDIVHRAPVEPSELPYPEAASTWWWPSGCSRNWSVRKRSSGSPAGCRARPALSRARRYGGPGPP